MLYDLKSGKALPGSLASSIAEGQVLIERTELKGEAGDQLVFDVKPTEGGSPV